jgi:hypothetical protein
MGARFLVTLIFDEISAEPRGRGWAKLSWPAEGARARRDGVVLACLKLAAPNTMGENSAVATLPEMNG